MTKRFFLSAVVICLAARLAPLSLLAAESDKAPVAIGSRIEMFVDDWLIDSSRSPGNVSLQLQTPVNREIVLVTDRPWEGPDSAYFTVFQDGPLVRLYYRGIVPAGDTSIGQVTCYAESTDGIHFTRPSLGLVEFDGSKENNIIFVWTPTNASWLNIIECQFTELKQYSLDNTFFKTHAELQQTVKKFLRYRNARNKKKKKSLP